MSTRTTTPPARTQSARSIGSPSARSCPCMVRRAAATATPGDVFFSPDGAHLVGTEVGTTDPSTFRIDSFLVGADGRLTPAAGSPFAAQGAGPFGSEFRPTNSSQLFVSNAHGGASNGSISAFNVAGDGG